MSATTPPIEPQLPLPPPSSQNDSPSSSSEGSKKRAISEVVADDSAAPLPDGDSKGPAKKKTKLTEAEMEEKRKEKEVKEKEKEAKEKEKAVKVGLHPPAASNTNPMTLRKPRGTRRSGSRMKRKRRKTRIRGRKMKRRKRRMRKGRKKIGCVFLTLNYLVAVFKWCSNPLGNAMLMTSQQAQTRLQNFFVKPAGAPNSPAKAAAVPPGPETASPEPETKQRRSDYERTFQPFFVKPNVIIAPPDCFQRDYAYKSAVKISIDKAMSLPKGLNSSDGQMQTVPEVGTVTSKQIAELLHISPHKRGRRGKLLGYTTKDLLARINAPDDSSLPQIINLKKHKTSKGKGGAAIYLKLLNSLPNKFLRFAEDVRPPYSGTFTRKPVTPGLRRGRNPFQKTLPGINYDYDSEAEWEEGAQDEDGEELLSDDGEEDEEAESLDDEMDGFLDDEEDEAAKGRRGALAALVPLTSGLCWEDEGGRNSRAEFEGMKMEVLLGSLVLITF